MGLHTSPGGEPVPPTAAPMGQEPRRRSLSTALRSDTRTVHSMLLVVPFSILFALTALPLVGAISISLFDWNLADPDGPRFIGLQNYATMLASDGFWNSVWRTIYQVVGTVVGQLIIGMGIALLLARNFRGAGALRSLYLIPMMMTPVVVGLTWRMLFDAERGMINYLLSLVGVPGPNWLGDATFAMPAVIITDWWLSTPFVTVILLAGILSIPNEVYEAARVDGAGPWMIFRWITLPLLKPMILLALLFRLMDAIKRFDSIYVMTGGGPGNATETLDLHAYFAAFQNLQIGYGAAIAAVILLIMFSTSTIILRAVERSGR